MAAENSGIERYETKTGETRWRVRWRENGRHCSRTFHRAGDADAFRAEITLARTQGRPINLPRSRVTLAQFVKDEWWPKHAMLELDRSTRERHRQVWNKWVLPALGAKMLTAIDTEDLADWQVWAQQQGIGHATLLRCRAVLSGVFRFACLRPRRTGVRINPVAAMTRPKRPAKKPARVYPPTVFELMRAELRRNGGQWGQRDSVVIGCQACAGLRPGEVLNLRVRDVRERTIEVAGAIGLGEEKGTKTGRVRQVPLLKPLRDDLMEWIEVAELNDEDLLFPAPKAGGVWTDSMYRNWRRRVWRPLTEKVAALDGRAELAGERPYACRHSFASLMIRAGHGNNPKALAEIMGHDLSVLLGTYASSLAEFAGAEPIDAETEIQAARRDAAHRVG